MIKIDSSSVKPIYEQITEQLKMAIITGQLKEGTPLPSIRQLAKELKVSVITTKRAYTDLEQEGLIETFPSKGSFVAYQSHEKLRQQVAYEISLHLEKITALAASGGITKEEILALFEQNWREQR